MDHDVSKCVEIDSMRIFVFGRFLLPNFLFLCDNTLEMVRGSFPTPSSVSLRRRPHVWTIEVVGGWKSQTTTDVSLIIIIRTSWCLVLPNILLALVQYSSSSSSSRSSINGKKRTAEQR
jgi:hypothetical protein